MKAVSPEGTETMGKRRRQKADGYLYDDMKVLAAERRGTGVPFVQLSACGTGTYVAAAANSCANIFWEGLSGGQPVMLAWLRFSGTGRGSA